MADNVQTTSNPAEEGHLVGAFRQILNSFLKNVDDWLPVRVISFDVNQNTVLVQPLIMLMDSEKGLHRRAQITVPVFTMGGGNALIRFNLKKGDLGWIKASDRDISSFISTLKEAGPNTLRKHSFDDAIFMPDVMKQFEPQAGDDDAFMVMQTIDGSVRLSMFDTGFKLKGDLDVDGKISATGDIESDGDVKAGSVSLTDHDHDFAYVGAGTGSSPQTGTTEPPT